VIAFPKAASGLDPLTRPPTPITPAQRREAGIDATPTPPTPHAAATSLVSSTPPSPGPHGAPTSTVPPAK